MHLKDRQVGKEKIEGLGFTSQMSMDLLLMEMEKLMAKDHSGGTFAQMWVHAQHFLQTLVPFTEPFFFHYFYNKFSYTFLNHMQYSEDCTKPTVRKFMNKMLN